MGVKCLICGREFNAVNHLHLSKHGVTTEEYIAQYPQAVLTSKGI
jgi:hypothetical protein